ncbi:hypothetical protein K0M31_004012 [Melipona bicolor]|uniref:Uncharacterized protein n=1 Tax=Melipona bicolor TaxID=60889 RepID=A0AA40FYN2_9HYME|nr:hypothetical protein K0M31_004012 [Melipona bicolor]
MDRSIFYVSYPRHRVIDNISRCSLVFHRPPVRRCPVVFQRLARGLPAPIAAKAEVTVVASPLESRRMKGVASRDNGGIGLTGVPFNG